jgi:hypothetical protein
MSIREESSNRLTVHPIFSALCGSSTASTASAVAELPLSHDFDKIEATITIPTTMTTDPMINPSPVRKQN